MTLDQTACLSCNRSYRMHTCSMIAPRTLSCSCLPAESAQSRELKELVCMVALGWDFICQITGLRRFNCSSAAPRRFCTLTLTCLCRSTPGAGTAFVCSRRDLAPSLARSTCACCRAQSALYRPNGACFLPHSKVCALSQGAAADHAGAISPCQSQQNCCSTEGPCSMLNIPHLNHMDRA